MLSILLSAVGSLAPVADPVYSWRLAEEHYASGAFGAENGELALTYAAGARFVGEGDSSCLVRRAVDAPLIVDPAFDAALLPREQLTVAAWVAVDVPTPWGGFLGAVEDDGNHERGFVLGHRDNKFCFAISTEGGGRLTYLTAPTPFSRSLWYHVAGTYDGEVQRLYVDGNLVAESQNQSGAIAYEERHAFVVGAFADSDEDHRLTGALREVGLWDRALAERAVRNLYVDGVAELPGAEGPTFSGIVLDEGPSLTELQPKINEAIDRGVEHLLQHQNRDGSWSNRLTAYRNGPTALALYALIESGLPREHPAIEAALGFLAARDPVKTYSFGCQLLALGALGDPEHRAWVERLVEALVDAESGAEPGAYGYPSGAPDLSNTQFAALGFYGASKLGVHAPVKLWQRLVERTIEGYRPQIVELPGTPGGELSTERRRIAGFSYRPNGAEAAQTGSMTTAGLCVLELARQLAGDRLGGKTHRALDRASREGMGWLAQHFAVDRNPNGGWHYYYLYGVERVGALFDVDRIGGHAWYAEGADWLVRNQKPGGEWGGHDETCFALLFLTRATSPLSGGEMSGSGRAWWTDAGDVRVRATGRTLLTVWVTGLADELAGEDPAIARVTYFADGAEIATVEGDASTPWSGARFPIRHEFPEPGDHRIEVEVELAGELSGTFRSETLAVRTLIDPGPWMRDNLAPAGPNLLPDADPGITVSSFLDEEKQPLRHLTDGLAATAWYAAATDAVPTVTVELDRPARADRVVLYPADANLAQRRSHDTARRVELQLSGERHPIEVALPDDPLAPIEVVLPKPKVIRGFELRVVARDPGNAAPGVLGFSEIELRLGDDARR